MAKPIKQRDKWRIRWIDHNGERQSEVFHRHEEAKRALRRHETEAEEIRLGIRLPVIPNKTFSDLDEVWVSTRKGVKRAWKDEESILRCHLRPFFGDKKLREVDTVAVKLFTQQQLVEKQLDPKTAHNHLTILISMLRLAVEMKWLAMVPKIKKPKIEVAETDFRYLRDDDEVDRFLAAAEPEGVHIWTLYLMAICTGMRAGELAAVRWSSVDLDRQLIRVDGSFDTRTKSGAVRHVPILTKLAGPLREWRLASGGRGLVFTNERGAMYGKSARVFQEVLHRVLKRGEFAESERRGRVRRYITFHDLRHTFASTWMAKGGDLFRLQKILGHRSVEMTMRYAHLAPDLYVDDLDRFGPAHATAAGVVVPMRIKK